MIKNDIDPTLLEPIHIDLILKYEQLLLDKSSKDFEEKLYFSWQAPWRLESLSHYLGLGWSFSLEKPSEWENGISYYLAQPILFMSGHTHTLWIEHFSFQSKDQLLKLIQLCVNVAKDKHMQRVLFKKSIEVESLISQFNGSEIQDNLLEIKTTKGK